MRRPALLFGVTALLSACQDPAPAPQTRTMLAFLKDEVALEKAWSDSRNDPGGLGRMPDCVNAGQAKSRLLMLGRERAIADLKEKE